MADVIDSMADVEDNVFSDDDNEVMETEDSKVSLKLIH